MSEYNINNSHNDNSDNAPVDNNLVDRVYERTENETTYQSERTEHRGEDSNTATRQTHDGGSDTIYTTHYKNPYTRANYDSGSGASYTFSNDPSYGAQSGETKKEEKPKSKKPLKIVAAVLAVIFLALSSGVGGGFLTYSILSRDPAFPSNGTTNAGNLLSNSSSANRAPVNVNKVDGSNTPATAMTEVISNVRDSVVEIVTENIEESQFYGQYVTSGAGSGVIISEDGYIITNHHVIDGANNIYVRTTDEKEYKAVLVGSDEESDVGVIKIEATGLSPATLGDSSAIKLGEQVIAIGNPLGSLGGTVTDGIISALDREVTIGGQKMVLLQTNAAVNPGNSGGGLFNLSGHLIGVVNAKSSSSSSGATIEGLGFAIPINHAFDVASQLIEYGYVKGKVSLGISVNVYEKDMIYSQGFKYYTIKAGVYVDDPGKNTELKKNDRFVAIAGITVSTMADIKSVLSEYKVGDTVKATVARTDNNKEIQVEVTLTCFEYVPANVGG